MHGIDGGVAVVTGGSSGIGRASALRFAEAGASVVVANVVEESGEETVSMIENAGGEATFVRADVSDPDDVEAMVEVALEEHGGLDFAHNNAGIEGANAPTADQAPEDFQRVIDINLTGVWLGLKHEIPAMLADDGGAIVNTSSVAGLVGFPDIAPYVAAKHGVIGLTRTAALEYSRQGVRVNAVCPGVIDTPMVRRAENVDVDAMSEAEPIGRLGEPEEIAEAVVWLCSDAASFVTGHPMAVDGGWVSQ